VIKIYFRNVWFGNASTYREPIASVSSGNAMMDAAVALEVRLSATRSYIAVGLKNFKSKDTKFLN
jgi:hypothetical protein